MNNSLVLSAPAKLNLFLHITGRRSDGYHLLQTVFQFLDHSDTLTFTPRSDNKICLLDNIPGVPTKDNLIYRAARALKERLGVELGVDIGIKKILPMGGGLGGGSSNAATVLVGLNKLWNTQVSKDDLAALGLKLGADVPIFVHGHAAWAEGVGEKIQPVTLAEPWFLVVSPGVEVSTAKIFSDKRLTRDCPAITIRAFLEGHTQNVCEKLVSICYPDVAKAIKFLDTTRPESSARMTGTGSSVFASYADEYGAKNALKQLPECWQGFVAKGCNVSPLYAK